MATFKAKYRCRLCGEEYYSGAVTGSYSIALKDNFLKISGIEAKEPQSPTMLGVHGCNRTHEGSIGIADYIGWEKDGDT